MKRRVRLEVEELSERILPSGPALSTAPPSGWLQTSSGYRPAFVQRHLHGAGQGRFFRYRDETTAAIKIQVRGAGIFQHIGSVKITGELLGGGSALQNKARGTLTLRNDLGSLTLALTAALRTSQAAVPNRFTYQVVSGTGHYQTWRDIGTLQLTRSFDGADRGIFYLTIF